VQVRDCAGPHNGEVYVAGVLPDGPVDEDALWRRLGEECRAAFRAYVGVPENVSAFTHEGIGPAAGNRSYACLLYLGDDHYQVYGSARDSLR